MTILLLDCHNFEWNSQVFLVSSQIRNLNCESPGAQGPPVNPLRRNVEKWGQVSLGVCIPQIIGRHDRIETIGFLSFEIGYNLEVIKLGKHVILEL